MEEGKMLTSSKASRKIAYFECALLHTFTEENSWYQLPGNAQYHDLH